MYHVAIHQYAISQLYPTKEECQAWIDRSTQSDGHIPVYYRGSHMRVLPSELEILDDLPEVINKRDLEGKMAFHPRCPKCGETIFMQIGGFPDIFIGHMRCPCVSVFMVEHTGKQIKVCPWCSDGGFVMDNGEERSCPYCLNGLMS